MHVSLSESLRQRSLKGNPICIALIGAGFIGKALARRISRIPGMRLSLIVNRTIEHAVESWVHSGAKAEDVVISDDPSSLSKAILDGRPAASIRNGIAALIGSIDVVVETTSSLDVGAIEAMSSIRNRKDFVTFSAELDATVGCYLKAEAEHLRTGYAVGQGDQPAVLWRLLEETRELGFIPEVAVNCKGFLDIRATPASIREWCKKQGTSPKMTAAFTDGTKMQIEQNVVANAARFLPVRRGMIGIRTDLAHALSDFEKASFPSAPGAVDFTLGGDFGAGVFVIARSDDPEADRAYLRYLKMGDGPKYLLFKPWHLCHLELAVSVAEMAIFHRTGISSDGPPTARTVSMAKRALKAGERLDGIGGFMTYGQLDLEKNSEDLLPVGISEGAVLTKDISIDEPIPMSAVELDEKKPVVRLFKDQEYLYREKTVPVAVD